MTREQFIEKIAPIIVKYAPQYNVLCPSAVIGQAVLESDGGNSELAVQACNYFGLKYRANRCPSACGIYYKNGSEQNADGSYTTSAMQWMKFSNMDNGVRGYFDFTNISNYSSVKGIKDPKTYLEKIKACGYATSLKYVENVYSVVQKYNLTKYDNINTNTNNKEENKMGFTNSPLATYKRISPNKTVNRTHEIDTITIHCIVGQWTAKQGCDYFAKSSSKASCNYVVGKDGSIGLCVEEKDRSWCSSNAANDHRAITIEVASDTTHPYAVTDKALETLIKLCADICKRNGIKKLVWSTNKTDRVNHLNGCNMTVHRDFKQKSCPGAYLYERHGYIANEVNKLLGVTSPNTSTPIPSQKTTVTYTTHRIPTNSWGSEITGYNLTNSMGYSGSFGKEIDKFTAKLSEGKITYTVHRDGKWGGEINGYSKTDTNNYAGSSNKPIDAITIKAEGINGKLKYRVHRKTDNKWGNWITGYSKTDTNNYAGSFGKPIDAIQIGIE